MIKAILFDFDGVIRQWDESDLWTFESDANVERGTVFEVAFSKELHQPLTRGELKWDEWRKQTEQRLVATHGNLIRPIVKRFFEFEGRIDDDMVTLIEQLPSELLLGILTNNHDKFEDYLARVGLEKHFDKVVNTHRVGVAKPDPESYLTALNYLGVQPSECLFIDDVLTNVEGAESIGLKSHLFENQTGLISCLKKFDIKLISDRK